MQWLSERAEGAYRPGYAPGSSQQGMAKMGMIRGIGYLATFEVAKLQSVPGADNLRYATGNKTVKKCLTYKGNSSDIAYMLGITPLVVISYNRLIDYWSSVK